MQTESSFEGNTECVEQEKATTRQPFVQLDLYTLTSWTVVHPPYI